MDNLEKILIFGQPVPFKADCDPFRLLSSGSLVLLSPSNEDEGYFECTAVNDVGEERRVIEVILQGIDFELWTLRRK